MCCNTYLIDLCDYYIASDCSFVVLLLYIFCYYYFYYYRLCVGRLAGCSVDSRRRSACATYRPTLHCHIVRTDVFESTNASDTMYKTNERQSKKTFLGTTNIPCDARSKVTVYSPTARPTDLHEGKALAHYPMRHQVAKTACTRIIADDTGGRLGDCALAKGRISLLQLLRR